MKQIEPGKRLDLLNAYQKLLGRLVPADIPGNQESNRDRGRRAVLRRETPGPLPAHTMLSGFS